VSKIVSVKFHKAEENADENNGKPLVLPVNRRRPAEAEEKPEENGELVMAK
jgi:hypothetical protein